MSNTIDFEAPSTSRLAINHDIEKFSAKWQDRVPFRQTKIASAVHMVLEPKVYVVRHGDTIADVARIFGITVPPSLFGVKEGQEWHFDGASMINPVSGTSFPVRAANQDRFTVAA